MLTQSRGFIKDFSDDELIEIKQLLASDDFNLSGLIVCTEFESWFDSLLDTLDYEEQDSVQDNKYFGEINNQIYIGPVSDPVFAEITVKIGPRRIPELVKEVCDCFNFPISVHIDFYFVVRSKKRYVVSIFNSFMIYTII